MDILLAKINRIVVLLHGGLLKSGNVAPLALTDREGIAYLEDMKKKHMDAGAVILYDGPPNTEKGPKRDNVHQVFFYENEFYPLSNFSAFRLIWKGIDFHTSETAYQWEKFPEKGFIQDAILLARSAHDAFKIAERYKHMIRPDWNTVKEGIMLEILREKVKQHPYVLKKIMETGDRQLIEDSWRDDFWGWGPNKDGQNILGKLWMQIRDEIKSGKQENENV